jgi:hypothetical protein
MHRRSNRLFEVDYAPLAEALLTKTLNLDPANDGIWSQALTEFRKLRQRLDQTR